MKVAAVARSGVKGVPKDPVDRVRLVREWGVEGDAHGGPGPRQVSVLALPSIQEMEQRFGAPLGFGRFGENLVVDGSLEAVRLGDLLGLGRTVLEVTAIGKECHSGCAIRVRTGDCIMPREGVFGRVAVGGEVMPGDPVRLLRPGRDLGVAVLAGGRSTRFGSDKRQARLPDGRTLLESAIERARELLSGTASGHDGMNWRPLVSVGAAEGGMDLAGCEVVPDAQPDAGPLAGVVACLERLEAPAAALFAVDQPGVTADLIRALAVRCGGAGVCLELGGRLHPLPVVLDRERVLPVLRQCLARGVRSLHGAWAEAGVEVLDSQEFRDLGDPEVLLANWNRPENMVGPS